MKKDEIGPQQWPLKTEKTETSHNSKKPTRLYSKVKAFFSSLLYVLLTDERLTFNTNKEAVHLSYSLRHSLMLKSNFQTLSVLVNSYLYKTDSGLVFQGLTPPTFPKLKHCAPSCWYISTFVSWQSLNRKE